MTAVAAQPMIGVSCGHRVPRIAVPREDGSYGFRYWCPTCNSHRMSGGRGTGLRAFDWALQLRELVEHNPDPVIVDDPGTDHGRRLVLALGAQIRSGT